MKQNIFAYTQPTGGYPSYVSINQLEDSEDVEITVRSPPSNIGKNTFREGVTACMRLPKSQLQQLVDAAAEHK